jgi:hypothetical protein
MSDPVPSVSTDAPVEITQTAPPPAPAEDFQVPPTAPASVFQPAPVPETDEDEDEEEDGPFAQVKRDIRRAERRARRNLSGDMRREFAMELYPLLAAIVEAIDERTGLLDNAFTEIIEQTESFLQPDLSLAVAQVLNLGKALAEMMMKFQPGMKLGPESAKQLHALAQNYLSAVEPVTKALAEATLDPNAVDDDEDEEGDEK